MFTDTSWAPPLGSLPRLALWMVLNLAPDGLVLIGPDCSSWSICSRFSSMRNFMNVRGNMAKSWVGDGFSMVSRNLGLDSSCAGYYICMFLGYRHRSGMGP